MQLSATLAGCIREGLARGGEQDDVPWLHGSIERANAA